MRTDDIPISLLATMASLAILGVVYAVKMLIFNVVHRKTKVIKMTSPNINSVILSGAALGYCSMVLLGLDFSPNNTSIFLQTCAYVIPISFTLVYGSVLAKVCRVHMIFTNIRLNGKSMRDEHLILVIVLLALLDLVVLIPWQIIDPITCNTVMLKLDTNVSVDYALYYEDDVTYVTIQYCSSRLMPAWILSLYAYKGVMFIALLYIAWVVRHVTIPSLRDSRRIAVTVFAVCLLAVTVLPVLLVPYTLSGGAVVRYAVGALSIWLALTVTISLLFVPNALLLRRQQQLESSGAEAHQASQRPFSESMTRTKESNNSCCSRLFCSCSKVNSCFSCWGGNTSNQGDDDKYAQELLLMEMETLKRTIKEKDFTIRELNDRLYVGAEKFQQHMTSHQQLNDNEISRDFAKSREISRRVRIAASRLYTIERDASRSSGLKRIRFRDEATEAIRFYNQEASAAGALVRRGIENVAFDVDTGAPEPDADESRWQNCTENETRYTYSGLYDDDEEEATCSSTDSCCCSSCDCDYYDDDGCSVCDPTDRDSGNSSRAFHSDMDNRRWRCPSERQSTSPVGVGRREARGVGRGGRLEELSAVNLAFQRCAVVGVTTADREGSNRRRIRWSGSCGKQASGCCRQYSKIPRDNHAYEHKHEKSRPNEGNKRLASVQLVSQQLDNHGLGERGTVLELQQHQSSSTNAQPGQWEHQHEMHQQKCRQEQQQLQHKHQRDQQLQQQQHRHHQRQQQPQEKQQLQHQGRPCNQQQDDADKQAARKLHRPPLQSSETERQSVENTTSTSGVESLPEQDLCAENYRLLESPISSQRHDILTTRRSHDSENLSSVDMTTSMDVNDMIRDSSRSARNHNIRHHIVNNHEGTVGIDNDCSRTMTAVKTPFGFDAGGNHGHMTALRKQSRDCALGIDLSNEERISGGAIRNGCNRIMEREGAIDLEAIEEDSANSALCEPLQGNEILDIIPRLDTAHLPVDLSASDNVRRTVVSPCGSSKLSPNGAMTMTSSCQLLTSSNGESGGRKQPVLYHHSSSACFFDLTVMTQI